MLRRGASLASTQIDYIIDALKSIQQFSKNEKYSKQIDQSITVRIEPNLINQPIFKSKRRIGSIDFINIKNVHYSIPVDYNTIVLFKQYNACFSLLLFFRFFSFLLFVIPTTTSITIILWIIPIIFVKRSDGFVPIIHNK